MTLAGGEEPEDLRPASAEVEWAESEGGPRCISLWIGCSESSEILRARGFSELLLQTLDFLSHFAPKILKAEGLKSNFRTFKLTLLNAF